jgi:hypothetical protein
VREPRFPNQAKQHRGQDGDEAKRHQDAVQFLRMRSNFGALRIAGCGRAEDGNIRRATLSVLARLLIAPVHSGPLRLALPERWLSG